ncbi:MAG TPA: aminoglycoside adenylyltransferase domain-containing protein [Acidimicrobiales bacterium]|nr:aminoglycoside adenylyltransferase domain-containing protein [Acidimicrobiales bacterium]
MSPLVAEILPEVVALTHEIVDAAGAGLIGMYVHGSAVLGDFQVGRSDLDVLLVVEDKTEEAVVAAMTATLAAHRASVGTGIEASVVDRSHAFRARPPWRFRSHVTTTRSDCKIVSGTDHAGDPDLALHYLIAREVGWAATGPQPTEIFGQIDHQVALDHLAAELRWAAVEAPTTYGVLNSCRALRFADDHRICSKTDGGRWALERGIRTDLVSVALAHRSGEGPPPSEGARAWVVNVAEHLLQKDAPMGSMPGVIEWRDDG